MENIRTFQYEEENEIVRNLLKKGTETDCSDLQEI